MQISTVSREPQRLQRSTQKHTDTEAKRTQTKSKTMKSNTFKIEPSGEREIVMTRVFDATPDLLFDALTKPELVKRWLLGPPGWSMPVCEIDLKVGGSYRYVWRNEDGREMGMGGKYREIVRPERIVHSEKFDEAWYPGEALVTTTLVEKGGSTTLITTMRMESREARDEVLESGMESGVAVSYDRLEKILSSQVAKEGASKS
jgi:uncharacterized protein YndB with AHSA1/START domain